MNQTTRQLPFNAAPAALWASAFVILALIIVQAGRLPGNPANANMVTDRGSYTVMSSSSGRGPDANPYELVYVIDSREQMLLVYEIEDARKKQIVLRDGYNLDTQFQRARQ
jgi:hypothetical protein